MKKDSLDFIDSTNPGSSSIIFESNPKPDKYCYLCGAENTLNKNDRTFECPICKPISNDVNRLILEKLLSLERKMDILLMEAVSRKEVKSHD